MCQGTATTGVGESAVERIASLESDRAALIEALRELVELADFAMLEANRDGGEFDRTEDLKDARALLARMEVK